MSVIIHSKTAARCIRNGLLSGSEIFAIFSNKKVVAIIRVVIEVIDDSLGTVVRVIALPIFSIPGRQWLTLRIL